MSCHTHASTLWFIHNIIHTFYLFSVGSGVLLKAMYETSDSYFSTPNISAYSIGTHNMILYVLTNVSIHCWENTSNAL